MDQQNSNEAQPSTPSMTDQAQVALSQVKDAAEGFAAAQASSFTKQQLGRATGTLNTVATAFRQTGSQLREQKQEMVAGYLDKATAQIERFAGNLERKDLRDLLSDVEGYARREPLMFIGGAFALGLVGARFLKASGRPATTSKSTRATPDIGSSQWASQVSGSRTPSPQSTSALGQSPYGTNQKARTEGQPARDESGAARSDRSVFDTSSPQDGERKPQYEEDISTSSGKPSPAFGTALSQGLGTESGTRSNGSSGKGAGKSAPQHHKGR